IQIVGQKLTRHRSTRKAEPTSMSEGPTLKWGDTQPANPRQFERWSANIAPQNGAEKIQFNPLDPSDRQTKITPEGYIDAGSRRRYAQPFTLIRIILADCGWRQDRFHFRNSVEDGLNKCV